MNHDRNPEERSTLGGCLFVMIFFGLLLLGVPLALMAISYRGPHWLNLAVPAVVFLGLAAAVLIGEIRQQPFAAILGGLAVLVTTLFVLYLLNTASFDS